MFSIKLIDPFGSPARSAARTMHLYRTRLEFMASLPCTLVLYESPHRIKKTLKEALEHCGANRPAAIVREISKFFEETIRGTLSELVELSNNSTWKGEIVLVIGLEP